MTSRQKLINIIRDHCEHQENLSLSDGNCYNEGYANPPESCIGIDGCLHAGELADKILALISQGFE